MLNALPYAFAWRAPDEAPAGALAFSYHRGLQPVLWALLGASLLETAVLHLLLAKLWSLRASLVLLAVSVLGLIWLVGLIRSLARRPILVTSAGVQLRCGLLFDDPLPLDRVAAVTVVADPGDLKRPGLLKASLLAYPNTLIELSPPMPLGARRGRSREISAVAPRPDDAPGFAAAVAAAGARPSASESVQNQQETLY